MSCFCRVHAGMMRGTVALFLCISFLLFTIGGNCSALPASDDGSPLSVPGILQHRSTKAYNDSMASPDCVHTCEAQFADALNEACSSYHSFYHGPLTRCIQTTCPELTNLLDWQNYACPDLEPRHDGEVQVTLSFVLFALATASVIGRFLSRSPRLDGPGYWWDDWCVLLLWALAAVEMAVCLPFLHRYGAGTDVSALDIESKDIVGVGLWVYISEPFYIIGTCGMKVAMVLLYLRMWESNTGFRKTCYVTVFFLLSGIIGFSSGAIYVQWPYNYYKGDSAIVTRFTGGVDLVAAFLGLAGLNIFFDIWVLLLPISKLMVLKSVTYERKLGICVTFLLGFVVTACSIVRLTSIPPLKNSVNLTWDIGKFGMWSEIEVHLSFVTANLPALAGLWHRLKSGKRRSKMRQTHPGQSDSMVRITSKGEEEIIIPDTASSDDGSGSGSVMKDEVAYSAFTTPPLP